MNLSRRAFILRTSLLLPAVALGTGGALPAGNRPWRRKWNGQLPLKNLPIDEALEIIYDRSLKLPIKPIAAGRIHQEVRMLLIEFKAILKKANGNLTPYLPRIQYMTIVIPAGFNALAYWGKQNQKARTTSTVWITDLLKQF